MFRYRLVLVSVAASLLLGGAEAKQCRPYNSMRAISSSAAYPTSTGLPVEECIGPDCALDTKTPITTDPSSTTASAAFTSSDAVSESSSTATSLIPEIPSPLLKTSDGVSTTCRDTPSGGILKNSGVEAAGGASGFCPWIFNTPDSARPTEDESLPRSGRRVLLFGVNSAKSLDMKQEFSPPLQSHNTYQFSFFYKSGSQIASATPMIEIFSGGSVIDQYTWDSLPASSDYKQASCSLNAGSWPITSLRFSMATITPGKSQYLLIDDFVFTATASK